MSIANKQDHKFKVTSPWLCLGDRATLKTAITGVLVNDGKNLNDKSIAVTFLGVGGVLFHGVLFHWNFVSADQLNAVLDELGLEYHPTTETGV